jgi:hypothetical protein
VQGLLAATNVPTTKDFVTALRARMAHRQDYTSAATFAQQLLAKYPIANRTQYTNMYTDTDNTEIIFKLDRADADRYDRQGNTGSVLLVVVLVISMPFTNLNVRVVEHTLNLVETCLICLVHRILDILFV